MSRRFKMLIFLAVFVGVLIFTLSLPVFHISVITIEGLETISERYVLDTAGIKNGMNIFTLNKNASEKALKSNQYIDSVDIIKILPDTVTISVRERYPIGCVEFMKDVYLYIDENGRILEIASVLMENLPIIKGLSLSDVNVGSLLHTESAASFNTVITLTKLLIKYEMQEESITVDVSDASDVRLYIYNIDVHLGDLNEADEKIYTLKEILDVYPDAKTKKCRLDLTEIKDKYFLRVIT